MAVASSCGLGMERFRKDMTDLKLLRKLAADHTFAADVLGIFGTPTLVFREERAVFLKLTSPPPLEESYPVFAEIRHMAEERQFIREIKRPVVSATGPAR